MLQNDNIGRLATFSMRSLRRTYQNGVRQMPPSDEEVIAVTVQLPAPARCRWSTCLFILMRRTTNRRFTQSLRKLVVPFWTLDSQSCDVQFDSATTGTQPTLD